MAVKYGVSLTTVKRWIAAYGIKKPAKRSGKRKQEPRRRIAVDDGMTLIEKAQKLLGDRLQECRFRGYVLDGRPVRTDAIIAAAGLEHPPERVVRRRAESLDGFGSIF